MCAEHLAERMPIDVRRHVARDAQGRRIDVLLEARQIAGRAMPAAIEMNELTAFAASYAAPCLTPHCMPARAATREDDSITRLDRN